MKKMILILLTTCSIISCSKEEKFDSEKFDSEKFPQKWTLIKMTGQIPNSETTGENMEWQEYYILESEGTFIKVRERDGIHYDASGTFSIVNEKDGKLLELVYETNSAIIGSCYANQTESLWLDSRNTLTGTWSYCDGPGLEYKRVE